MEPDLQHVTDVSCDFECGLKIRSGKTNCIYIQNSGGSRISRRGGMDLRRGHFLVKMYVKTKELGPNGGGGGRAPGTPPRTANAEFTMEAFGKVNHEFR